MLLRRDGVAVLGFAGLQRCEDLIDQSACGGCAELHGDALVATIGRIDEVDAERVVERCVIG